MRDGVMAKVEPFAWCHEATLRRLESRKNDVTRLCGFQENLAAAKSDTYNVPLYTGQALDHAALDASMTIVRLENELSAERMQVAAMSSLIPSIKDAIEDGDDYRLQELLS